MNFAIKSELLVNIPPRCFSRRQQVDDMPFRRSKNKFLVVLTLVLAFTGQTLVAAAASSSMNDTPNQMLAMSDHNMHHGHSVHNIESSSSSNEKCCHQDSTCPMSSCMSTGIVPSASITASSPFSSGKIHFFGHAFASAAITSLYRPPISR